MKVNVKLYGTLRQRFPAYRPSQGIEVEIPDRATVKDLLALLDISESQGAVVVLEGRIMEAGDRIRHGTPVVVFQSIQGGRYVHGVIEEGTIKPLQTMRH